MNWDKQKIGAKRRLIRSVADEVGSMFNDKNAAAEGGAL